MAKQSREKCRCAWCGTDPIYVKYHDEEWGVPLHDDTRLFEAIVLDGAQAGLSWITILKRREGYRRAFDQFDVHKIVRYGDKKVAALLQDSGIIRNRQKVASAIRNAKAFIQIQQEFGSFDKYYWGFVDGKSIINKRKTLKDIPPKSPLSDKLSKDLQQRGMNFVGSTIIYAMMQATGMVNDHLVSCFRHQEVMKKR